MTIYSGLLGGVVAAAVAIGAGHSLHLGGGSALRSPFPAMDLPASAGGVGDACPAPPPPIRDIQTVSKYGANGRETDSSVVDQADAAKFSADTRPILDFTRQVARFADGIPERRHSAPREGACALEWLDSWARKGALLGAMSPTGEAVRKWELATMATAYLKLGDLPRDQAADRRVRQWLGQLAMAVRADYSHGTDKESRNNNHLYWAAWAVMAAAIATDDHRLFDWAIDRFHFALSQIAPDGTLPLELRRRQLALSYHAFALGPLIMLREGALRNGVNISPVEERRLQALVDRVVSGLSDPSYIAGRAGYPQDLQKVTNTQLGWLEPYYARSQDARVLPLISARRPIAATRLGGELTAIYAPGLYAPGATPPRRSASADQGG